MAKVTSIRSVREALGLDPLSSKRIDDSALHAMVRDLVEPYRPGYDKGGEQTWSDFYLPVGVSKILCVPFSVSRVESEYYLHFAGDVGVLSVTAQSGRAERIYFDIVQSALRFTLDEDNAKLECLVPYTFRTGTIKAKDVDDEREFWTRAQCEELRREYAAHLEKGLSSGMVSLYGYVGVAAIGHRAVTTSQGLDALELYKMYADARHGGMLNISKMRSVREFNRWLDSNAWSGSHPFEIVAGSAHLGIHLLPPDSNRRTFVLSLGSQTGLEERYLKMLTAMVAAEVPVTTDNRDLERALGYVSGETEYTVNRYSQYRFSYTGSVWERETYFDKISWDDLSILERA